MGYITDSPERWAAKRQPSEDDRAEVRLLTQRSTDWHRHASNNIDKYCRRLGYSMAALQTPEEWMAAFAAALLRPEQWGIRRTIFQLNRLSQRRSDRILLLLYVFAQHGRIQFLAAASQATDPGDGSPFEELSKNHHNVDHLLLRLIGSLAGMPTSQEPANWIVRVGRWCAGLLPRVYSRYLGTVSACDVNKNMMARWARVADAAAGFAPRRQDTLVATWQRTAAPASEDLRRRGIAHLRAVWDARWPANPWAFLLFCGCDAVGVFWIVARLHHLLLLWR
jgi:hypothetical protein